MQYRRYVVQISVIARQLIARSYMPLADMRHVSSMPIQLASKTHHRHRRRFSERVIMPFDLVP